MKMSSLNPWRKPTVDDVRRTQVEDAKLELLKAQSRLDWETSMVEYYKRLIDRLENESARTRY